MLEFPILTILTILHQLSLTIEMTEDTETSQELPIDTSEGETIEQSSSPPEPKRST